jgi:Protein of unknown function (DUF2589)
MRPFIFAPARPKRLTGPRAGSFMARVIDLSNLVSAIQLSVQSAGDALARASYESLGRYFVDAKAPADAKQILEDALRDAAARPEGRPPEEVAAHLADSLRAASAALSASASSLQPRTVAIDYPRMTSEGPVVHTVHVPLITLAPVSGCRISKLTFRADLDVQVDSDGALKVSFAPSAPAATRAPPPSGEGEGEGAGDGGGGGGGAVVRAANTSIEIVVEQSPTPDGLRKIIEGYERALRAQIPG